jgi:hypothetical protein
MRLQESAAVSFSLSFLLQILGAVILGVWGYSQLDARISELAQSSQAYGESIDRIDDSMEKNQDMPISSDHVQNTSLRFLEAEHRDLLRRLDTIDDRIYELTVREMSK